ncbi:kinase-like domain-containing protein [Halteromyces radiatus]|uniref:kinase-like domain-containing protein n=1 Tax=Halteromyces radiatus TaxID=101107 RepID=UPI002220DE76|nr:kinase-like domain-containing protein [Halteromyces radiatus]KAI8096776.1 kinase-like domain-containing protein [Halteromyces radiatus]
MSVFSSIFDALVAATSCCIPNPNISINGRAYRIIKLLGEGGFSFVYLAQDGSGNLYALKKIRCTLGTEEAEQAQREVDIYRLFEHPNIIRMLDTSTITESDGSKTIYIFLPYYKKGNLQDAINRNNLNKTHFTEQQMLQLFHDICVSVAYLHTYKPPGATRTQYAANGQNPMEDDNNHPRQDQQPLLSGQQQQQESSRIETHKPGMENEIVPWAHRDIKPGNVLISDDGMTPILMDFGSSCEARIPIHTRQEALAQQDLAAEHCSMPYRAPELFDVKSETTLDEKVDIWSLGCTLYCMAYGQSPFEAGMNEQGGSIALAVLNGQFRFPSDPELDQLYSQAVKDLISHMLVADPTARPDIHRVIDILKHLLDRELIEDTS